MLVGREEFDSVLEVLNQHTKLSADTETTGLRPYHGDRLFSIIIAIRMGEEIQSFYFNFLPYDGMSADSILLPSHLEKLKILFGDPTKFWYFHNAKYDMRMLAQEGIFIAGTVHCTQVGALLEFNEHRSYSLQACAERIGEKKDDAVENYIKEHKLTSHPTRWINVDGKPNRRQKPDKHFDRVPAPIIIPYGEQDGIVGYRVGERQEAALEKLADETPPKLPSVRTVLQNERRLLHTVFRMEHRGVRIDRDYCVRAASYEFDRAQKAREAFKRESGREFKNNSSLLYKEIFASEKDKWGWNEPTQTGQVNPCFESDVLKKFENPAARAILQYRDAKSKHDFYSGFLYHADRDGIVHPNFNQDGAGHGRFSSSDPNFQNLTSEEDKEELAQEFVVRRAIIPREGFVFFMPDYDQMEYRMMFDVACDLLGSESEIVTRIKQGFDPHQATADTVTAMGTPLNRKRAKNGNFAYLYGSGYDTLAATIGGTRDEAIALKRAMKKAAPEVDYFVKQITAVAKMRGFIFNWCGRRCHFPDPNYAYRAPNYYISGGCADVVKIVMNRVDEYLLSMRSKMIMTVHDELPTEVHESEAHIVPRQMVGIMESVYPAKYLPLTVGAEWSEKSLADKRKGYPL